jgi:hypothetical protein
MKGLWGRGSEMLNAGRDIVACRRPVSSGGNKPIKLEGTAVLGPLSEIKYNQREFGFDLGFW